MPDISVDRRYLEAILTDLVRINSVNPSVSAGGRGEAEIASHVESALAALGLAAAAHEHEPGRVSAVGVLGGTGGGRSLMLNAHCDTVGVDGMREPFSASIRDGKLYGRGAYDMKGSLAAQLAAVKALRDARASLAGDLIVAAAADEESRSIGTSDLISRYPVDGAIVTEPTEFDLCLAHKGFIWFEVVTEGLAAHGSRYDQGIDANMRMGRFLHGLEVLERKLRRREGHALVGPPSLHAPVIKGGAELSTYSSRCALNVERRTVPGETEESAASELQSIVDELTAADPSFRASVKVLFARRPFEALPGTALADALVSSSRKVLGRAPEVVGRPWWTDAALIAATGAETAVVGPSGGGPHAEVEWVDLDSLVDFAYILAYTALEYCGPHEPHRNHEGKRSVGG
jgi:acetylornithine deacetylase